MLILDIFAQHAQSRDGKLQVELAQLKYTLPRLHEKNTMMSRLTGGIGGRGPGETKLEINRRRARDRIHDFEQQIEQLGKRREQRRSLRTKNEMPIVSIVGYTNAGKSTLLNTLTQGDVLVEDKLFATLDPTSRRLRFPSEREIIITDTVGFIRDLPKDLVAAFRATLEELEEADLLLHVVDAADPAREGHIRAVERILERAEAGREAAAHRVQQVRQAVGGAGDRAGGGARAVDRGEREGRAHDQAAAGGDGARLVARGPAEGRAAAPSRRGGGERGRLLLRDRLQDRLAVLDGDVEADALDAGLGQHAGHLLGERVHQRLVLHRGGGAGRLLRVDVALVERAQLAARSCRGSSGARRRARAA